MEVANPPSQDRTPRCARWKINEWRTLKARENQDPLTSKRQQQAAGITFGQVCDEWITINHNGWSPGKLKDANLRLKIHGKALAGDVMAHINTDAVELAIRPLWDKAHKQARRTLALWKRLFAYAKHKGYFTGSDNPAEWTEHLEFRFHKQKTSAKHHASMPYQELPAFLKRLRVRQMKGMTAVALDVVILTGLRTGEVLNMVWSEVDWNNRVLTIPRHRMKRKDDDKDHQVPLCDRVLELLKLAREYSNSDRYPFTGYDRKPLNENVLLRYMRRQMGVKDYTVHGFRSSFKTWSREQTDFQESLIEICLDHKVGNAVENAYWRGQALEKRRAIMNAWSSYCAGQ